MVALTRQHAFASWLVAGFLVASLLAVFWQ